MFDKLNLINVLAITICFAISAEAIQQHQLRFKIPENNGVLIQYVANFVKLEYANDDLKLDRQDTKAQININKATIEFFEGRTDNGLSYPQYDLPNGSKFQVAITGTGNVSVDGKGVRRCKFTYSEKNDAPIVGINDEVKKGILRKLSQFDNDLCRTIRF